MRSIPRDRLNEKLSGCGLAVRLRNRSDFQQMILKDTLIKKCRNVDANGAQEPR